MNFRELLNKLDEVGVAPAASNADALSAVNGGGAKPAAIDPTRVYAYRRAQAAMARLEKAAQYTGTDEIVRSRAGLPPPLPSIEQWDGSMPKPVGRPDWINRWLGTGGGATGDVEKDQTAAGAENDAFSAGHDTAMAQLKQLTDLVAQLKAAPKPAVKEGAIANALLESFGYQLNELDATDAAIGGAAYGVANPLEKKLAAGAAGAAVKGSTSTMGKIAGKALPGVGAAFGAVDAYNRAKKGDYFGAGIAGLSGALSLVPGIGWMPAVALDLFNLGRDMRGPTASPSKAEAHPVSSGPIAQLQRVIGADADGVFGPKSQEALKAWQAKNGLESDGVPGPKTFAAAKIKMPGLAGTVSEQISSLQAKIEEAQNPASLYFILEDGNLYELTPENELYVLDEGLAGDAISGLAKYGKSAWDAIKGGAKNVVAGVKSPTAYTAGGKSAIKPGTKGATAFKAGQAVGRNPVKTALGAGALGYAMGNNSGADDAAVASGGGSGGGSSGAAPGDTTNQEQQFDPAVIDQIGELMSTLAQSQDEEVMAGLDTIRAQIAQLTGGRPLEALKPPVNAEQPAQGAAGQLKIPAADAAQNAAADKKAAADRAVAGPQGKDEIDQITGKKPVTTTQPYLKGEKPSSAPQQQAQ